MFVNETRNCTFFNVSKGIFANINFKQQKIDN